jgi:hypothetical protein
MQFVLIQTNGHWTRIKAQGTQLECLAALRKLCGSKTTVRTVIKAGWQINSVAA